MTRFISYYARRNNLLAVIVLAFGTSIFLIPSAQAAYANTSVICSNGTDQRSYQIGWDNSNIFFADKGYIPRFFCEGGYANPYRTYISDTLNGGALGYYQGVIPTPVEPTPVVPSDTTTATSGNQDTQTATSETQTATADTNTATSDTSTSSSDTTTTTSQQETPTATQQPTDSSTPTPSSVDGSTATTEPQPQPAPVPPVPPVVQSVVQPEPVVAPEEEPLPEPEPTVPEEVAPEEAPEPITEPEVEEVEETIPEEETTPEVEEVVTLDNGVVITQEQAVAIAMLENPAELLQELFTNPAAAFAALNQVGADMSPEVRERSEEVVVAAVIVGNIASAAGAAAYRRKP